MTWLVAMGLTNSVMAGALALVAWSVGHWGRRPALSRILWIVVLAKLLTPPLYEPAVRGWFTIPLHEPPSAVDAGRTTPPPARDQVPSARPDFAAPSADILGAASGPQGFDASPDKSREHQRADARSPTAAPLWRLWQMLAAAKPPTWVKLVAALWAVGSIVCATCLALRTWRFRRFLARAAHFDLELSRQAAELVGDAGLQSSPPVLLVESVVSPMLWGVGRRACLLFPAELARRMQPAARDALLLHELAHYASRDWLIRLLELAAQVIYWWYPLVGWARHEIEAAEEERCDAWVLEHQAGTRRGYAEALLATLDFLCGPVRPLPPAACGLGPAALLRARLTQIMCGNVSGRASRGSKALGLVVAALALPVSPGFVGLQPHEAAATSAPRTAAALVRLAQPAARATVREKRAATSLENAQSETWFVARPPAARPKSVLYATAASANGRYQLEARTGQRATLMEFPSENRLDLSSYRIVAASFSPDSRLLATGQDDESGVRLWDCETGGMLRLYKGSEAAITSVAFAPDGARLAAGAADGSVLVWNVGDDDVVARLPRQDMAVSCVRWSKGGDRVAIALSEWSNRDSSTLLVWRPGDAMIAQELSLDTTSGALEWFGDEAVIIADWNGTARIVDLALGMPVGSRYLGKDSVSAAAFSPDCRLTLRWQAVADQRLDQMDYN